MKKNEQQSFTKASHAVEHDSLWIPRSAILANILPSKSFLHDYPPSLIKPTAPALHDGLDSFLPLLVQALSTIPTLDILAQVKVCTAEAGFDVVFETILT